MGRQTPSWSLSYILSWTLSWARVSSLEVLGPVASRKSKVSQPLWAVQTRKLLEVLVPLPLAAAETMKLRDISFRSQRWQKPRTCTSLTGLQDEQILSNSNSVLFGSQKLDDLARLRGIHRNVNLL